MSAISPGSASEAVFNMLMRNSPSLAEEFRRQYSHNPFDGAGRSEIDALNSFWREQLCQLPAETINERSCLCASDDNQAWVQNFELMVLPTVIRNKLPQEPE